MKRYVVTLVGTLVALPFPVLAGNEALRTDKVPVADDATAGVMPSQCDAVAGNLVANCGFETGNFTNWTQSGDPSYTSVEMVPHSGSFAASLGPVTDLGFLAQTLSTTGGQSYNLSIWLRNAQQPNHFQVYWDGSLIFDSVDAADYPYTQIVFNDLVASGGATELKFGFYNLPDFFFLDDIVVVPTIPPDPGVHVERDLYSGLPNPEIVLRSESDLSQLRDLLSNLTPTGEPDWPILGPRGFFLINDRISGLPDEVRVFAGVIAILQFDELQYFQDVNGLEAWLTARFPAGAVNDESPQQTEPMLAGPVGLPLSGAEPAYNPNAWNRPAATRQRNNCYNYACNKQTNTFAQPGRFGGVNPAAITCAAYGPAAVADGLVVVNCNVACAANSYKVALVIRRNVDFHWYRQDNNGNWSHKPGRTEATNRDNARNLITDPRTANRGLYADFCGCYCVNPARVNIR